MKRIAMSDGINWMWFLVYSIEDGKAVIHAEDRHHKGDEICQKWADAAGRNHYSFVEPRVEMHEPRMITHLVIDDGNCRATMDLKDGPLPRFGHGHLRMLPEEALA